MKKLVKLTVLVLAVVAVGLTAGCGTLGKNEQSSVPKTKGPLPKVGQVVFVSAVVPCELCDVVIWTLPNEVEPRVTRIYGSHFYGLNDESRGDYVVVQGTGDFPEGTIEFRPFTYDKK